MSRLIAAAACLASALGLGLGLGLVGLGVAVSGCDNAQSCTLVDCDHEAVVTFPAGLVSGPYDLALAFGSDEPLLARCLDPGAPELADNPVGLSCDAGGFTLGGELAGQRTVMVTISDPGTDDVLVAGQEVRLEAVDELRPNGPDCDPVCFVRNGQLDAM